MTQEEAGFCGHKAKRVLTPPKQDVSEAKSAANELHHPDHLSDESHRAERAGHGEDQIFPPRHEAMVAPRAGSGDI